MFDGLQRQSRTVNTEDAKNAIDIALNVGALKREIEMLREQIKTKDTEIAWLRGLVGKAVKEPGDE